MAVTRGPGLVGCLLVGVGVGEGLATAWSKPLTGVNHLWGHIYAAMLPRPALEPPLLDFEVVLNESMRLSEDEGWAPDVADRQERVEAAFEHAFEQLIGSPKQQPKLLPTYHRFRNHLLRMWSAFQEAQAEHDKAERESAERFWTHLRLVRSTRAHNTVAIDGKDRART